MDDQSQLQRYLSNARFEVLPLRGAEQQAAQLPAGTPVTVTSSQAKGIDATLDLAVALQARGLHAIPHLAARSVAGEQHLSQLLDRIGTAGITEVFVIAGDPPEPAGVFPDALSLLQAMDALGRRPERVGISGYPESHAFLADADTITAMTDKSRHADYIVSQICFDPNTIASWIKDVRARGVRLPIYVGAPGAVEASKLLRISMKIGLGESMRFLRKQRGVVTKLLTRYTPEQLFDELAPLLSEEDEDGDVVGWHLYTFNEIGKTVQWRQDMLARLQEVPA